MPSAPVKELLSEVLGAVGKLAPLDDIIGAIFSGLAKEQRLSIRKIAQKHVMAQQARYGAENLCRGLIKQIDATAEAELRQATPEQREALLVALAEAAAVKLVAAASVLDDYARAQAHVVTLKRAAEAEPAETPGGLPGETNPRRLQLVEELKRARAAREAVEKRLRAELIAAGKAVAGEW